MNSREFEAFCDQFETALRAGDHPEIPVFLTQVAEPHRSKLLCELIQIELWHRRNDSCGPEEPEFQARFPDDSQIVAQAFNTFRQRSFLSNGENNSAAVIPGDAEPTFIPAPAIVPAEEGTLIQGPHEAAATGDVIRYFGDYDLLHEVARGGMGVVYRARQVTLNRVVALKMILLGKLAGRQEVQRFKTEAEAAAKLDHPGIVPIYEIGEHKGQHFFSMGFVEGQSLSDRVRNSPLPPKEAASIIRKIALAVEYAHQNGVIHRDLKPANVLLDRHGEPRVTDFGLAKKFDEDNGLTATGQILGTPGYMSPEQAAGRADEVSPLADVYSLGATLYCLLTGRPPFQSSNVVDTLKQVVMKEPVSPRLLNSEVAEDLETICMKCLEKSPEHRLPNAQYLADELARYLNGEPVLSRQPKFWERAQKWCSRNRAETVALGAISLVAVLGSTIFASAGLPRFERAFGQAGIDVGLSILCFLGPMGSAIRKTEVIGSRKLDVTMMKLRRVCAVTVLAAPAFLAFLLAPMAVYLALAVRSLTPGNSSIGFGGNPFLRQQMFLFSVLLIPHVQHRFGLWRRTEWTWTLLAISVVLGLIDSDLSALSIITFVAFWTFCVFGTLTQWYGIARVIHVNAYKLAETLRQTFGSVPWPFSMTRKRFELRPMLALMFLSPLVLLIGLPVAMLSLVILIVSIPFWAIKQLFPDSPLVTEAMGYLISLSAFTMLLISTGY